MIVYGKNVAKEVLKSGKNVEKIILKDSFDDKEVFSLMKNRNLPVEKLTKNW